MDNIVCQSKEECTTAKTQDIIHDRSTSKRSVSVAKMVSALEAKAKSFTKSLANEKKISASKSKTIISDHSETCKCKKNTQNDVQNPVYMCNTFPSNVIPGAAESKVDSAISFHQDHLFNASQTRHLLSFGAESIKSNSESYSKEHSLSSQTVPDIDNHIITDNTLKDTENVRYDFHHNIHSTQETVQPAQKFNNENWRYRSTFIENSTSAEIVVDPSSTVSPHDYWENFMKDQVGSVEEVIPLSPESEIGHNCIRFVCISDTHDRISPYNMHHFLGHVPGGDVLLHTGDFTLHGDYLQEYKDFNHFLSLLPHRLKLAIPGNHEIYLDPHLYTSNDESLRKSLHMPMTPKQDDPLEHIEYLKSVMNNTKLLIDNMVEFCGIQIYGLPWVPQYGVEGFGLERGYKLLKKYNQIPAGIDILMSHGPVLGFCDVTHRGLHVGCAELLNSVRQRIKPKYVVHGHIHEAYGIQSDGKTTFINAAICDKAYNLSNDPIVFDYPLPHPYTRQDFMKLKLEDLRLLI